MSLTLSTQLGKNLTQKISSQMRAVLSVLIADQHLMTAAMPFVDLHRDSIKWEEIYKIPLSPSHKAAVNVTYGVWTDEQIPGTNFFGSILNMETPLQTGVLRALALRWGHKA